VSAARSQGRGLAERLRQARASDPVAFRARLILAVVLLYGVLRLALGSDPFTSGVAVREAEGKVLRTVDFVRSYGWWAAAANAGLAALLLATLRLWHRGGATPCVGSLAPPAGGVPRWLVALLAAAVLAGGTLAAPRLTHGLWGDETFAVRHAIGGQYRVDAEGTVHFEAPRWRDTLHHYRKPYNHVPFSALARLSQEAWAAVARPDTGFVNEVAVRLPAFLAGLASVAVAGLFLWRIGLPVAGAGAAWLLALHPWHLQYTSEARGYAQLMLLVSLVPWLLVRALHHGSWPRWLAFGAAQLLLLWTNPGALAVLVVANAVAVVALLRLHRGTALLAQQAGRWLVTNVAAAMAFFHVMAPNLAQLDRYLRGFEGMGLRLERFVPDLLSHLWLGTPFGNASFAPHHASLANLFELHPALLGIAAALASIAVTLGFARLLAAGAPGAWVAWILLLPGPLALLSAWVNGHYLYVWYLIFALPGVVMLLAVGLTSLFDWLPRAPARTALAAATLALYLAFFSWATSDQRENLRTRALWPIRDSVLVTRPTLDPRAPEQRRILTASFESRPPYYDPWHHGIDTVEELQALIARADEEGLPLFLNLGPARRGSTARPALRAFFEESGLFEEVAVLHGIEPKATRYVHRYVGAGGP
jgi:hypothetical protein